MRRLSTPLFLIILVSIYACKNSEDHDVAGGPCSYNTVLLPAEVIVVYKTTSGIDAELVILDKNQILGGNDSLLLSQEIGRELTSREADSLGLKEGTRFRYVVRDIIDGHCTDHLENLELQAF